MAALIHNEARRHGIRLALGHTVEGLERAEAGIRVLLKEEAPLYADMVILAIGVTPDTHLAKDAGLKLGIKEVSQSMSGWKRRFLISMQSAMPYRCVISSPRQDAVISLAGPANKQGRIAADNICGRDSRYPGSQGSSVIKVFDLTAAATGINETAAARAGIHADSVILSPMSHAGYYPAGK